MGELELVARLDNRLVLRDAAGVEYRLPICSKLKSLVYAPQSRPHYAPLALVGGADGKAANTTATKNAANKTVAAQVGTSQAGVSQGVTASGAVASGASAGKSGANSSLAANTGSVTNAGATTTSVAVTTAPSADSVSTPDPHPRLRPAELQIRLRAGDTPEQLALVSELTAEQIARFAGPIEAERASIIRAMQRVQVPGAPASSKPWAVGDLIARRFAARGMGAREGIWYARREIGAPWLIELKFDDGGRSHSARWTFDHKRLALTPLDEQARWLISPESAVTDTVPISLHQGKRPEPLRGARGRATDTAASADADYPLVSGAPRPFGIRNSLSPADSEAPPAAPKLRAVGTDTAPAASAGAEGSQPGEQPGPVAGIVPISRWQAEKLETVAMPIATASLPGTPNASASGSEVSGSARDVLAAMPSGKAVPGKVNSGKAPSGKGNPVNVALRPAPAAASAAPAPVLASPPKATDVLFEPLPASGALPSTGRSNGRKKMPNWDEIVFGSKK